MRVPFTRHTLLIALFIAEQQLLNVDIKYVQELLAPFSAQLVYPKLKHLSVEIGSTVAFFNLSTGPKRAHCVIACSFFFHMDDWLEREYKSMDEERLHKLRVFVEVVIQLYKDQGIGEQQPSTDSSGLLSETAVDYVRCLAILRDTGKTVFETEPLFNRWKLSIVNFFECYFLCEIPAVVAALKRNQFLTDAEHADHRFCSAGLPWLNSYQYTLEHQFEHFSDFDSTMALVSQWGSLHNDALSFGKEEPVQGELLHESRVHRVEIQQQVTRFEAMAAVCDDANEKLELVLKVVDSLPSFMRPYIQCGFMSWLNIFPYHLQTSRYGWKKA